MAIVIDTSVVIGIERLGLSFSHALDEALQAEVDKTAVLTAMTVSELLTGIYRLPSSARRLRQERYVEAIVERYPILPFGRPEARVHAQLWAELISKGQMISGNDLIVAATAIANRCSVFTHNMRDFERVPGLTVRRPAQ